MHSQHLQAVCTQNYYNILWLEIIVISCFFHIEISYCNTCKKVWHTHAFENHMDFILTSYVLIVYCNIMQLFIFCCTKILFLCKCRDELIICVVLPTIFIRKNNLRQDIWKGIFETKVFRENLRMQKYQEYNISE